MYTTLVSIHGFIIQAYNKPIVRREWWARESWNSRAVHKYSSHENSKEIDHEKQNKSHVQ